MVHMCGWLTHIYVSQDVYLVLTSTVNTCDFHFQNIIDSKIYVISEDPCFAPKFITGPLTFLPVYNGFYLSKRWVVGSLKLSSTYVIHLSAIKILWWSWIQPPACISCVNKLNPWWYFLLISPSVLMYGVQGCVVVGMIWGCLRLSTVNLALTQRI